jgi:hypothetical protein
MYLNVGPKRRYNSKAWISSGVIVVELDIAGYDTDRILPVTGA